jgi:excisionase family DNA binding protein
MWGGNLDYFVLIGSTLYHYAYNGAGMTMVSSLNVSGLSNPIAAAASGSYPNAVVATSTSLTQYSYNGSGMSSNPALSVAGLTGVVGIGTRNNDIAALTSAGKVNYNAFNGSSMVSAPSLSITSGLSNPIDMSLFPDTYDCVVLEPNQVVYYGSSGRSMTQNPALTISGLSHPVAIYASSGQTVDILSIALKPTLSEEILTVLDIAHYLRISRSAAYELTHEPDFPSLIMGRKIRIRRDSPEPQPEEPSEGVCVNPCVINNVIAFPTCALPKKKTRNRLRA